MVLATHLLVGYYHRRSRVVMVVCGPIFAFTGSNDVVDLTVGKNLLQLVDIHLMVTVRRIGVVQAEVDVVRFGVYRLRKLMKVWENSLVGKRKERIIR